jgi:DNA-cytosine methyltransferase
MEKINVLSLFDGISGCRVALDRIGIETDKYYASEIDKYAIQIAQHNYPDTKQLGSVLDFESWDIDWSSIDLVTGGFPCQAWSIAGKQLGDKDERGMLFWTMLDVMKKAREHNPNVDFLIENVKMKREFEEYITFHTTEALGDVHKILINSSLVSAQNRNRYYWTSFEVEQPEDKGLVLADIIEDGIATSEMTTKTGKSYGLTASYAGAVAWNSIEKKQRSMILELHCEPCEFNHDSPSRHADDATDIKGNESIKRVHANSGKSPALTTMGGGHREPKVLIDLKESVAKNVREQNSDIITSDKDFYAMECESGWQDNKIALKKSPTLRAGNSFTAVLDAREQGVYYYRKLTPLECERLQTLPDNYTLVLDENGKQLVSNSQRYKSIGNGWTIDVIAHILKQVKEM